MITLKQLERLVRAFDGEHGLPESVFTVTCELLSANLGPAAQLRFSLAIDATEGCFYLPQGKGEEVWADVLATANESGCHGALRSLFDSEDDTGCNDDLTVVSKSAVDQLREAFDKR